MRVEPRPQPEPSAELRAARRAILEMQNVVLLRDWQWHKHEGKWGLQCRLTPKVVPGSFVPTSTDWFILASSAYPWGSIKFYPAKREGLTATFPHQSYNSPGRNEIPWRTGCLCLDTPAQALGRRVYDTEPFGVHSRLRWHVRRALAWLEAASRGELVRDGEPFELPQYPVDSDAYLSVVFSEAPESFAVWQSEPERVGIVEFYAFDRTVAVQAVKSFQTLNGRKLLAPAWGRSVTHTEGSITHGLWVRLCETPVIEPWQAPTTWGELRAVCLKQKIDLDVLLQTVLETVKDKEGAGRVALLGFPVPVKFGEAPERMHWQAIQLPKLIGSDVQPRGFRKGKQWAWKHNKERMLRDSASLHWLESENWFPDQLATRGHLSSPVTSKNIALLGGGSLGAPVAELLVRGSVLLLLIVDGDKLEAGNFARHSLGLKELNEYKAAAVAKRLNDASPHARIEAMNLFFPPTSAADRGRINECDLVIDCTGSDEVLQEMSSFEWSGERLFFSVSISLGAKRLFCFAAQGTSFPNREFRQLISPWLKKDLEDAAHEELPREGIGCWHPVFPARVDDMWLLASVAVKQLERVVESPPAAHELVVFEQEADENGMFSGVRRVAREVL